MSLENFSNTNLLCVFHVKEVGLFKVFQKGKKIQRSRVNLQKKKNGNEKKKKIETRKPFSNL
jgi:hypothetical protein